MSDPLPEPSEPSEPSEVPAPPAAPAPAVSADVLAPISAEPASAAAPELPPAAPEPALPNATAELSPAACAARLGELFPALFRAGAPLPLKLRIQADIQSRAPGVFTKKVLSAFLHRYTTSNAYLQALVKAPQRIDLDGAAAGELAPEHREAAVAELARRRALHEDRRTAEREAARAAHRDAQAAVRQRQPQQQPPRPAQQQRPQQPHQAHQAHQPQPRHHQQPHEAAPPAQPTTVVDAGRRERQALLRAFDTSTLTRANFCALKGLLDADLETALVQARQEAAQLAQAAPPRLAQPQPQLQRPAPPRPHGERPPRRQGPRG